MKNDNDSRSDLRGPSSPPKASLRWVLLGEFGLGVIAIGLARFFEISLGSFGSPLPWGDFSNELSVVLGFVRDLGIGVLATALPLVMMVRFSRHSGALGQRIRETARDLLVPMFRGTPWWGLALISVAAGWGEELFFRGFLYSAVTHIAPGRFGVVLAFWSTSLVFGVCHWVHVEYAILATAMGAYLALLMIVFDSMWVPITVHALYDFGAMWYLQRAELGSPSRG